MYALFNPARASAGSPVHPHPTPTPPLHPSLPLPSVLAWLKAFADARSLPWTQDAVGNLVIRRPGSGTPLSGARAPPVILQGHVDMVTEKNADRASHDFGADPLTLVLGGDGWLRADGTTLGADNGIGVAAALAVLDTPPHDPAPLPPIEALFTVDEETGLTGAFGLDGGMLTGRTLVNLDTEEWGDIFIGCAGGGDSRITLPVSADPCAAPVVATLSLSVSGLLGGHSGLCIHEGRGNAVGLAARLAEAAVRGGGGSAAVRLVSMSGGDKRNAIPRECAATVAVCAGGRATVDAALDAARTEADAIRQEYGGLEAGMRLEVVQPAEASPSPPPLPLTAASTDASLTLLRALPHGALRMSTAVPGLVETSNNLASVVPVADGEGGSLSALLIQTSTRSALLPALEAVRRSIAALATALGGSVTSDEAYPGWAPNPASRIVRLTAAAVEGVTGRAPGIGAIHAGLECGIISSRVPGGLDAVSFGPTITGAHSPDEAVRVDTVGPFYEALVRLLGVLAKEE